jgi:hypothetical protein
MVVAIGLRLAAASPSKWTVPLWNPASGGTKRITVPAKPQSTPMLEVASEFTEIG